MSQFNLNNIDVFILFHLKNYIPSVVLFVGKYFFSPCFVVETSCSHTVHPVSTYVSKYYLCVYVDFRVVHHLTDPLHHSWKKILLPSK